MNKIIDIKLIKFISVGIINTLVGTAVMLGLYNLAGCSYWFSSAVNYIFTSILSYALNRRFTFGYRGAITASAGRFALNIAICYLAAYGAAKPFAAWLFDGAGRTFCENAAMLTGMCIFTGLNYMGQRFFVFAAAKQRKRTKPGEAGDKNGKEQYSTWINSPYLSEPEKMQLRDMPEEERFECFCRPIEFGTAGMRGKMGLGTNRVNKYTIRMAARGLAEFLGEGSSVVIAYDTRNGSAAFAEETAGVLSAAGVRAYIFDMYSPVPLLSFAVRALSCDGGVAITASHNPKEYNGFKVYDGTGCQLGTEDTYRIACYMEAISDKLNIPADNMSSERIELVGEKTVTDFLNEAGKCSSGFSAGLKNEDKENLKIIYTPLHGSGRDFVMKLLDGAGFKNVKTVLQQSDYSGDFPTVAKPDPEDERALLTAADMLSAEKGDILIGTDPDCDRISAGVMHGADVSFITGNQMGCLLTEYLAQICETRGKTIINTVTVGMLCDVIAEAHGIHVVKTLSGFKNVGRAVEKTAETDFLLAYEDTCGYLTRPYIREKDAVSAALVICEMAAYYKARGKTLCGVLDEIYEKYGYISDIQRSVVFEGEHGRRKMREIMKTLRKKGKNAFARELCVSEFVDYSCGAEGLPAADMLKYMFGSGSRMIIRPSGTEPKMKIYYSIKECDAGLFDKLSQAMQGFLLIYGASVGIMVCDVKGAVNE